MKQCNIVSLLFLLLMASADLIAQSSSKEQLIVTLTDPRKSYKLKVGLIDGSISVSGYDGKEIIIVGETDTKQLNHEGSDNQGGMRRLTTHALSIVAQEKNNEVDIHSDGPPKNVRLSIRIPKGATSIKLETVNNGDIEVSHVDGEIEITNVNGGIKLTDVSGSVVANTVNGNVKANFKNIDPKAPMAFTTLNGDVDVSFPADLKANVKLRSDHGEIYTDFDIAINKSQPQGQKTKEGMMYKMNVKDWIFGKIGGGGPEILMTNMNGNIYARQAK